MISQTYLCWLLMLRCRHQKSPLTHQARMNHLSLRTEKNESASLVASVTLTVIQAPAACGS